MDIHAEVLDEQSLDYALEHIARDDGDHDPDEGLRRQREPPRAEPDAPEIPPEGRLDQVAAMIGDIAHFRSGDRAARELSADRVAPHEEAGRENPCLLISITQHTSNYNTQSNHDRAAT